MKKIIASLLMMFMVGFSAFAQVTPTTEAKHAKVADEIKTELISGLGLSAASAENVVTVEAEFHKTTATIEAETSLTLKEKEIRLNRAHVTRRARLMETPLTGRQMEDVIEVVEKIRRKHKL